MSIQDIKSMIPDFAKDLRLNLSGVLGKDGSPALTDAQRWGVAAASAYATGDRQLLAAIEADAAEQLDDSYRQAARSAAAIMGMNNVYYRFLHLSSNQDYGQMPARLRMTVIGNPGIEKADFELFALAVSAINGCGLCIDSHEKVLRQAGVSTAAIQDAVRIASVISAVAAILQQEA